MAAWLRSYPLNLMLLMQPLGRIISCVYLLYAPPCIDVKALCEVFYYLQRS